MKLEIGDIKMDSESGIQIGASHPSHLSPQNQVVYVTAPHPTNLRIPGNDTFPITIWFAAGGMAVVGIVCLLLVLAGQPWWLAFAIFLGVQIPTGWFVLTQRAKAAAEIRDQMTRASLAREQERLLEVFAQTSTPMTVSQLRKDLLLPEDQILELVSSMVLAGELDEDVDLETGHFVYLPATKIVFDADHTSAVERFATTQQQRAITKDSK